MIETYPNPWDFKNSDKELVSADGIYRIVYCDLNEIAMGAPIGGKCFLEIKNKEKILINNWCGGPSILETNGHLIAIPILTRKFWKGTVQQIGVVNVRQMELKIFSKTFRVLDLHSFNKNIICGCDSPLFKPTDVSFNIDTEKIAAVVQLIM